MDDTADIRIAAANYFVWTMPNDETYTNIHMEVTAINRNADPHAVCVLATNSS
ncbi:hypothetical protein [Candidatus Villigracilis affinis]|uniref:hypothetical protein n=1 Tax=Candidatus Villigracilis affinis TaxID=3140682 RepID=UPI002A237828|nr:hypothetical protein [Anaerolineales bacterium]